MRTFPRPYQLALPLLLLACQARAQEPLAFVAHLKVFSANQLVDQTTATLKENETYRWSGGQDGVNFDVALTLSSFTAKEALYSHSIKVTRQVKPGSIDLCSNTPGSGRIAYGTKTRVFNVDTEGNTVGIPAGCALDVTVARPD